MPNSRLAGGELVLEAPNSEAQKRLLMCKRRFILYGGARGGGKTWGARTKSKLLAFNYDGMRQLILRRTFPQLEQNFIRPMAAELRGFATCRDSHKDILFPNGSYIKFGYCDREADVEQYQGHEYDVIHMDEATHFTETMFQKLKAVNRGVNDFPKRMYLYGNPGGVGHGWVKRLFISRQYGPGENAEDYEFIPARVYDNASLMEKDPEYVKNLESLPADLRRAWLEGDWDVFIGQYFSEWRRDVHVVAPFEIPAGWRWYVALDYGLDMLAAYLIAVDTAGYAFVVSEVFEGRENGMGTGGGGHVVSAAAQRVRQLAGEREIDAYFAPPDLWNRQRETGRSTAEIFAEHGVPLVKANNNRVQGWLDMKEWLQPQPVPQWDWPAPCPEPDAGVWMVPKLRVFDSCPNLIEGIPGLVYSERNPTDCATEPHIFTHGPDAIRYFVAGRPLPAAQAAPPRDWDEPGSYEEQTAGFLAYGV